MFIDHQNFTLKTRWRELLAVLMLLIAVFFFRSERKELHEIIPQLNHANSYWVFTGIAVTVVYILAQAMMYVMSFRAIGVRYSLAHATELFLKRNFLSVFLPAGGISSLAYTPSHIRRQGIHATELHQASAIYAFVGFLSVALVGLPVIMIGMWHGNNLREAWISLIILFFLLVATVFIVYRFKNKQAPYAWVERRFPSLISTTDELMSASPGFGSVAAVIGFSILVELCGIAHVGIAMKALGLPFLPEAAALAYILSVLLMIVSPFLRGLGAVELSMALILGFYGMKAEHGLSVTILYRIFEFWLPLAAGLFVFAWKGKDLFIRIFPALLIFALGIVNIVSVVTPPLAVRVKLLHTYIPYTPINASNFMVLLMGIMLLVSSAFLLKGLKSAWWFAVLLSLFSLIGHLTKALDWEEALFAAIVLFFLFAGRKQYRIRHNGKLARIGVFVSLLILAVVIIFDYTAFYFIDIKQFGVDFTWKESLRHTLNIFLLLDDYELHPKTSFAKEFIWEIRTLGIIAWGFLFYTLIRPFIRVQHEPDAKLRAANLIQQYGDSSTDYFKTMPDKLLFFSEESEGMVAYRISGGYAIVLEEPVCDSEDKLILIREYERFCKSKGLIPAYYRVDESRIRHFNELRKRKLLIGQEAIVDIERFTLEGKDKKSLRNGLNSLQKKGYKAALYLPPHNHELLIRLQQVSDEWLEEYDKKEMVFSQGMFDLNELKDHPVIVVRDEAMQIKAFLNIIPDYAPGECTYDLIRKTADAPGGCMDLLIISFIEYARQQKLQFLNMGMVPMAGIEEPDNTAEKIIRFAYENVKRFNHYKGLRNFKEKYTTIWQNKYLVYENDFDLLQLPVALNKIMQP